MTRLEAGDFDKLMTSDTPRDLLLWLSDPEGTRGQWDEGTWAAFCNRCREDYGFDPVADGEIAGGEKLGQREGPWRGVWDRFAESPALYPGVPDLLRKAKPRGNLEGVTRNRQPDHEIVGWRQRHRVKLNRGVHHAVRGMSKHLQRVMMGCGHGVDVRAGEVFKDRYGKRRAF